MSQSSSAHHNQSPSSSNNNNNNNDDFQRQPPIIVVESDDDDGDDVMLVETVQKTLSPPPPVVCLVKTGGQLDYHDDCLCVKCRMIKEFLAKIECEQPNCLCGECRQAAESRQNDDLQQQPRVYNGDNCISDDGANEVTNPQVPLEPTDNASQPEAALSPVNDDDAERYSRSSTPDFNPFSDDDDDDGEEEEDEEMDQGDGSIDLSEANPKMPTSSSATNKKDLKTNPNECPFCKSKAHKSSSSMSTHYRVAHLNWKPYYCKWTNCAFSSGYLKTVETHVRWKHLKTESTATKQKKNQKAEVYVGKLVDDKPPTDKLLSDYLLKNTGIKWPVTSALEPTIPNCACPDCGRRFARPDLLECHVESHDSAGFLCTWPNCGYFYSGSVTAAKLHICHDHLGSSTGYSLRDMKEAKKYLQPVSGNTASSSAIPDSKVSQPSTSFALTNQYNEDDDVNVCDNVASTDTSSSQQPQVQQPELINGEFICPHANCLKRFPTKPRYKLHMITHSNKKPYECSHCMYKSKMKSNVATHFRREHSREKLFRCAFTGCSFEHSVYLDVTRHIRVEHSALECESGNWKKVFKKYVERCYLVSKRK